MPDVEDLLAPTGRECGSGGNTGSTVKADRLRAGGVTEGEMRGRNGNGEGGPGGHISRRGGSMHALERTGIGRPEWRRRGRSLRCWGSSVPPLNRDGKTGLILHNHVGTPFCHYRSPVAAWAAA